MRVVWEYAHGVGAQWVCYTFATFFAIITGGRARGAVRKASVSIKQARAMSVRSAMCGSWDGGREGCFPRSGRADLVCLNSLTWQKRHLERRDFARKPVRRIYRDIMLVSSVSEGSRL